MILAPTVLRALQLPVGLVRRSILKLVSLPEFTQANNLLNELLRENLEHPKLLELKSIVEDRIKVNPKAKIIVFSQYRDSVTQICKEMNSMENINAKVFVGQTKKSNAKGDEQTGLSQKEQQEIIKDFSAGEFNILVSTSIGEEGLDLPEVALVAIMDADIESFLRDKRSLIQTIGRAARNVDSKVIFYADKITRSMESAIDETNRRRQLQLDYNKEHKIKPQTVKREVQKSISGIQKSILEASAAHKKQKEKLKRMNQDEKLKRIIELEYEMQKAAERLDFETAIKLREEWQYLKSS